MKLLKKMIVAVALVPMFAWANSGGFPLDRAPERTELASLQNGAKIFVNYCLNCHSASMMRYNKLKDLGLTEEQIKNNLLFSADKVGDMMKVSLTAKDAKAWFGVAPPDLSVIARAKASSEGSGSDWLYTYLRSYYQDDSRPTGWNNMLFPNVGMPHVLWELQGVRVPKYVEQKDAHDESKTTHKFVGFEQVKPGKLSAMDYDTEVADLVAYLNWMGEPSQTKRKNLGVAVLLLLSLLALFAWRLNASYWKEVK
ncbi:cytochrome c1 [soil metagenome]